MSFKFQWIILFFSLITINGIAQTHYFLAGQRDGSIIYTDLVPDVKLVQNTNQYLIDMDKNGIADFKVTNTFTQGGMMSEYFFTTISALNKNKVIYSKTPVVQVTGNCENYKIANIFNLGDPINQLADTSKVAQIYYSTISSNGICEAKQWNNIGSKYIGIILNRNDSLIYGWIKVNLTWPDLTVMEYAVNNKDITQIQEQYSDPSIKVFPNPTTDFLHLLIPFAKDGDDYTLRLFNGTGLKISEMKIHETVCNLDLRKYKAGVYLLEISDNRKVYLQQKVVKH